MEWCTPSRGASSYNNGNQPVKVNLGIFTYVLGAAHLAITALTDFEVGLIKFIPFRIHGLIEIVVSLLLIVAAFWFYNNDSTLGFYYYLAIAGTILIVFILTDFKKVGGGI